MVVVVVFCSSLRGGRDEESKARREEALKGRGNKQVCVPWGSGVLFSRPPPHWGGHRVVSCISYSCQNSFNFNLICLIFYVIVLYYICVSYQK